MVLTDLPFARPNLTKSRYAVIRRPGSTLENPSDNEEEKTNASREYATFLKEQERKCGPDGFLDSGRYTHAFTIDRTEKPKTGESPRVQSTVDLAARIQQDKKDYERRLKVIEDHMWQHKQEERELKRVEGDVIKNQRQVRKTLRDYENSVQKKRVQEEKHFNQGMERYTKLQRDFVHKKEERSKLRTDQNITFEQQRKDKGRKVELVKSDLARQYRSKQSLIDLKRIEIMRLSEDFEMKMRQKEAEQFKLKQDLAEMAISLNMEAQKGRVLKLDSLTDKKKETMDRIKEDNETTAKLDNKLTKSDGNVKTAIRMRRKLSADLTLNRGNLNMKNREENRQLLDTRNTLTDNTQEQKALNQAALHAELDLKSKQIDQKLQAHDVRKKTLLSQQVRDKKERSEEHESHMYEKSQKRYSEQRVREHEDHLKHYQKTVSKNEDIEHSLYNTVRETEYARQKQEQQVRRLQNKLHETKRKNAIRLKEEMVEAQMQEEMLQQKLVRQRAELAKVHAQREESYVALQKHRELLREDKYHLGEHEREHIRLIKITNRSNPKGLSNEA